MRLHRIFQTLTLLFLFSPSSGQGSVPICDLSIIGAGLGGLYSAWRLAVDNGTLSGAKICIFEAKNRSGGRILTVNDPVPGFENYTIDLGAYRYNRQRHRHTRLLTEKVFGINVLCYTNPLAMKGVKCDTIQRPIITTRGKTFGIEANGDMAGDAFSRYSSAIPYRIAGPYQWGPNLPLKAPRSPYAFVLGPNSVVPEIARRWNELNAEKDYTRAMRIVDEIIESMKRGRYRDVPYSDIDVLQVATMEGWTSEEKMMLVETDYFGPHGYSLRQSVEVTATQELRFIALEKESEAGERGMVAPFEMRNGEPRRTGMQTILDNLISAIEKENVRIYYGAKVTFIERVRKSGKRLRLTLADGKTVDTDKVIANIGRPDLVALGVNSEPMKSAPLHFRRTVERLQVKGYSKIYCFWEDAWWLTKLRLSLGRTRMHSESLYNMRYHDGHVVCKNRTAMTGCRGGILVSYDTGDNLGAGSALYVHSHNSFSYSPLTNTDNLRRLIPGKMSRIEEVLFDDVVRQVRRVHRSSMAAKGFNVDTAITRPTGCVFGDWRDVGTHTFIGPGQGARNVYADFAKPVKDLDIALVSEAWGHVQGWAEASLISAERALFHQYGLPKPAWMDVPFHKSVIEKYNRGL